MSEPLDELRAVLGSVEPSPVFEAQTLSRIERERAAAPKRIWMFLAPIAAAAVVIVAASLRPALEVESGGRLPVHPAAQKPQTLRNESAPVVSAERKPLRPVRRAQEPTVGLSVPEAAHVDQAIAVRRLMLSAGSGRILGVPDAADLNEDGSIRKPALIELKPIVITPVPTGQGGGSER